MTPATCTCSWRSEASRSFVAAHAASTEASTIGFRESVRPVIRPLSGRGVINLFDRYPPALPETFTGTGTGSSQYDNRGRYFFIGANMNF